jgi:hypothetical protein
VEAGGIGFPSLTNTQTIYAATFTIYYFDEILGQPAQRLSADMTATDLTINLTVAGTAAVGSLVAMGEELMRVDGVLSGGTQYQVTRGMLGTTAASHSSPATIYPMQTKLAVGSFPRDFFGSPASGAWSLPVLLPNALVTAAELFVTNSSGNSPTATVAVTHTLDFGLRTLSGGQYSIDVEGFLAVENGAATDLLIEADHSVRDIYAVVSQAPTDTAVHIRLNQNGTLYCTLSIPATALISPSQNGLLLPPLLTGSRVTLDITQVGETNPGSDLTVIIRL